MGVIPFGISLYNLLSDRYFESSIDRIFDYTRSCAYNTFPWLPVLQWVSMLMSDDIWQIIFFPLVMLLNMLRRTARATTAHDLRKRLPHPLPFFKIYFWLNAVNWKGKKVIGYVILWTIRRLMSDVIVFI